MAKGKKLKQYVYIVQASLEPAKCKIGITNDLKRRLKEYNSMTGKSKYNIYTYLFSCEVKDMNQLETDIKAEFQRMWEVRNKEIYFYNDDLFGDYTKYIKSHKLFIKEKEIAKQYRLTSSVGLVPTDLSGLRLGQIPAKAEEKKQKTILIKRTKPSLEERGMSYKTIMQKAKNVDFDEFFTRYEDIEKEIEMYDNKIWQDKVVFCNCDDPVNTVDTNTSAFALYFIKNFKELGLKKLICTHYSGKFDIFNQQINKHTRLLSSVGLAPTDLSEGAIRFNQGPKGYIFTKTGYREIGKKDYPDGYTGSFDDPLSLKILNEEADIVCTNPPFSRARDYWKILINSGKKFIIISNIAIILTTSYIHYFKNNKVWAGYNEVDWYLTPVDLNRTTLKCNGVNPLQNKSEVLSYVNKRELTRASGYWYTNIPIKNRPKYNRLKIVPLKKIPEKYKKYDDSKMLIVDNCFIPNDYKKHFGVSTRPILNGLLEKGYKIIQDKEYYPYINSKKQFARVLVQKI